MAKCYFACSIARRPQVPILLVTKMKFVCPEYENNVIFVFMDCTLKIINIGEWEVSTQPSLSG